MGEKAKEALKLQFDRRLRPEFHGARIASDAGLHNCQNQYHNLAYHSPYRLDSKVITSAMAIVGR